MTMQSTPRKILKDLTPLAPLVAKHHSLTITTMPTKQQRTLHDAWPQPSKRRRLNDDSSQAPNKSKKFQNQNENEKPSKIPNAKPNKTSKSSSSKPAHSLSSSSHPKRKPSTTRPTKPSPLPNPSNPTPNPNPPTTNPPKTNSKPTRTPTLRLTHQRTSLFSSPPSTLLLHATNCRGTWGAGIALQFRTLYPSAHTLYQTHCRQVAQTSHPRSLLGTTLLIPPQLSSASKSEREAEHWIGCLFTSEKVGRQKDRKGEILDATRGAVQDLVRQVGEEGDVGEVRMCKINSGLFGVPWEETRAVVESVEVGGELREVAVCSLD